jgi:hypothetical protein
MRKVHKFPSLSKSCLKIPLSFPPFTKGGDKGDFSLFKSGNLKRDLKYQIIFSAKFLIIQCVVLTNYTTLIPLKEITQNS